MKKYGLFFLWFFLLGQAQLLAQSPTLTSPTPPMGWMSWYTFIDHIDEKTILEVADAMVNTGLKKAGYNLLQLDDGWMAKTRDADGKQFADPLKFPRGIKFLADYLHKKGLKLGIYSSNGSLTCAGYPGSFNHEEIDAKTYAEWGVDYLKYDACGKKDGHTDEELNLRMINAIKKTGRPMLYEVCVFSKGDTHLWASKVATMWRTGGDIVQDIHLNPVVTYHLWYANLNQVVGKENYAGNGHWNDPDNLIVGYPRNNKQTLTEQQSQFSFWSLIAAPLLLSVDVRKMEPEIKKIITNTEVIAVNQDKLGKQGVRLVNHADYEIWVKELTSGAKALILFNKKETSSLLKFSLKELNLNGSFNARDLWMHKNLGVITENFATEVTSHGVIMLKLTKTK